MLGWLGVRQPNWETMTLMLFWSVAGVVLLAALWLLRGIRRGDAVQRAWLRVCDKLAREGVALARAEGPHDYPSRVARTLPATGQAAPPLAALSLLLGSGRDPGAAPLPALSRR